MQPLSLPECWKKVLAISAPTIQAKIFKLKRYLNEKTYNMRTVIKVKTLLYVYLIGI